MATKRKAVKKAATPCTPTYKIVWRTLFCIVLVAWFIVLSRNSYLDADCSINQGISAALCTVFAGVVAPAVLTFVTVIALFLAVIFGHSAIHAIDDVFDLGIGKK